MFNSQLIKERGDQVRQSIIRLREFARLNRNDFIADADAYAIAEHHLRRSLEAIFDVGRHLVVKLGVGTPREYRDVAHLLQTGRVIPRGFADKLKQMAGYRNRLVHAYAEITAEELHDIIVKDLEDFNRFFQYVHQLLADRK